MKDRLIVALDVDSLDKAKKIVNKLYPVVKIFKVGNELFTSCGPDAVKMIHKKGAKVFLDLKYHDIPNTVAKAVKKAQSMGVFMLNVHASGGSSMMKAAKDAVSSKKLCLLAVTVLTSIDKPELKSLGIRKNPLNQVKHLALLAKKSGMSGVVCSAWEARLIKKLCGKDFVVVTPGIRPKSSERSDQKRVATPDYAISEGADYIVVGRPITLAKSPLDVAKSIVKEIEVLC
ncbi:MAG: orotidine-5'-phosphate decarboxylase [Candidatus Omnitrophota bacterium]